MAGRSYRFAYEMTLEIALEDVGVPQEHPDTDLEKALYAKAEALADELLSSMKQTSVTGSDRFEGDYEPRNIRYNASVAEIQER